MHKSCQKNRVDQTQIQTSSKSEKLVMLLKQRKKKEKGIPIKMDQELMN